MAKTLLDLFKGSSHDLAVKPQTETFLEEETTGLRVKSAVELNNPLIYGNEAGRIMLRSTPSTELMKAASQPEGGTNGLLGKGISKITGGKLDSLSDVRNVINDKLGIPQPFLPTRVWNEMDTNNQLTVQDILDKKKGTEFGKFLKQTGGGSPKTIVNQAIGNAITLGKDKLRDTLFGKPPTINGIAGIKEGDTSEYKFDNTYTIVQTQLGYTDSKTKDDILLETWNTKQINLATVSPIYGVDRKSDLYNSSLGQQLVKRGDSNINNWGLSAYSSDNRYVNYADSSNQSPISQNSLEKKYGIRNISDDLNLAGGKGDERTTEDLEKLDLIPFWIGEVDSNKKTHFRTIITGLTETVSPSWNSSNFFGNPFSFYTYSSIERSVSFSLQVYCSNVTELLLNWQRVNKLTQYSYPKISTHEGNRYSDPPIINFRLGDIYNRKVGFIESLSYTYPDNGGWETDPLLGLLPKFIEVSITIKFIETDSITKYYDYEISAEAAAIMNDKNGSSNFSTDPALSSNGKRNVVGIEKLDTRGLTPLSVNPPKSMISLNGIKTETPHESKTKTDSTNVSEPKIPNTDKQTVTSLNEIQKIIWENQLRPDGYTYDSSLSTAEQAVFTHPQNFNIIVDTDGNSKASGLIERRLNKDPFKFPNKTYPV